MEDELSSIMPVKPNVDDLYFNAPNHVFKEEESAEIFKRNKQVAEDLEDIFGDMSVTMTEDDDDCQSSDDENDCQSSDDETVVYSCSRCSYENIGDTCVEAYKQLSLQPTTTRNASSLSQFASQSIHSNEDSNCSFVDNSSIHNDFNVIGRQQSNTNTPSIAVNRKKTNSKENKSIISNSVADYNKEIKLIDFPSNLCENCGTKSCLDSNISCKNGNDSASQFSEKHQTAGENEEDLLSSIGQHFADFHPISSDHTYEIEEAAEELERHKRIGEILEKELSNLSYISTDDDDEFHSSDDESGYNRNNHGNIGDSYVEACEQPSLQPNETGNSSSSNILKKQSIISNEDPHSSRDNSRICSGLNVTDNQQNNENKPSITANILLENETNFILNSGTNFKLGSRPIGFSSNLYEKNGTESDLDSDISNNHGNGSETASQFSNISSVQFSDQSVDLHEEFLKLQVLYNTQTRELEKIRREEIQAKKDYSHEVQFVKLRLTHIEGQNDQLTSALQESQKLISDFRHENNVLKGKLSALELQLSAEKEAKHSVCVLYWIMSVCVHIGTLLI